jgi:hypothetical protein
LIAEGFGKAGDFAGGAHLSADPPSPRLRRARCGLKPRIKDGWMSG